ncbi:putative bifunctional diguanylate cyclase/phosphodiesterase [Sphingomonas baiyangensis]|uniref:EAL domain-containing protein n=1 Tax=Sphingomonas baiyangensis TaxID=2572576 RepID=A0A4U1L8U6_9SPHN|nr:EAL domain-containing protein [Sphingomonas baiyangensis]TKD52815.1 EAL domain-containing protein [Sphingomonas baiyangensis]
MAPGFEIKRQLGAVRGLFGSAARDDEAVRAAAGETALRLVRHVEEHGAGWFWETDRTGRLTYLSAKVAQALGTPDSPALGAPLTALFQMDGDNPDTERTLAFHFTARTSFSDYAVRAAQGDAADRCWSISGRPRLDAFGQFQGFTGSGSDLSEKRRSEAEITRLALFDGLTGLANRQRMRLSLDQTLAQSRRSYRSISMLLLDLDRFKAVNDTLGHQVGDLLLQQVAQRLQRVVGESGLVGRLGGDEFQVMLPEESNRDRLGELARTIIAQLSQPYFLAGSSVTIGCSIGVAIAPEDGHDAETLVRSADLALYAAKADGRGVHRFYHENMLEGAQTRKALEDDLRHALERGELQVVYQPVVATGDARIVGYEALVRWQHPVRGPVSPADFIPIAEECGLIEPIGEWVLHTAIAAARQFANHARVAVNVSPIQFANPAFPAVVARALAAGNLAPERLELEITESVFLNESASTDAMFASLKRLGVRLALDDFGTGYSSLGYLRKAPFDKIKIDQSFVRGAAISGSRNAAIIQAIVTLAAALDMETTAEGVEVQDEIELIRGLGCSHIQGYVYGRPMDAEAAVALSRKGFAQPGGYRISRAPRIRTLRWARLQAGDQSGEVRIRNVSTTGAMIDGIAFPEGAAQFPVQIELIEGQMFNATVRWAHDGQAGLAFDERFNLERMHPPATRPRR